MAAITAGMVKELREMTGAGMMECKKALTETDGNIEAAVDVLKKNGIDKNYAANYIEGLSGSRYAEIYSSVEISKRIYKISEKDLKKGS